ncbi:MAG: hypothetical protein AB8B72_12105 [Crocinitomicaceae bacterium]
MVKSSKTNIIPTIFLELLSFTPIIIILGNIVPPVPIKVHFLAFGIVFLCALYLLLESRYKLVTLILASILIVSQFLLNYWDIKNIIDFLFGPLVLLILIDLLVNKKVSVEILLKYQRRFYYLLWIPIIIGVLQYLNVLSPTIWNADYINYAYVNDIAIPRPNGFLYHGSELSIIICFVALFQFFNNSRTGFLLFLVIVIVSYTTYFKAILGCIMALFFVFVLIQIKPLVKLFRKISDKLIGIAALGFTAIIGFILLYFLNRTYQQTGYFFDPQLMTGRGSIWNIFTDAISNFSIFNYLFGSGIGSGPHIFETYASAENYYILSIGQPLDAAYDAHNATLSLFINSGLFGLLSLVFLFRHIFIQVKVWQGGARRNKYFLLSFFGIIMLSIGITIPLFDMAIIWPCIGFLLIKWKSVSSYEIK